jgi:hypothetical protein
MRRLGHTRGASNICPLPSPPPILMARKRPARVDRALEQTEGLIEICPARDVGMSRLLRHPYPHPGFKGETLQVPRLSISRILSLRIWHRARGNSGDPWRQPSGFATDLIRGFRIDFLSVPWRKGATDNGGSPVSSRGLPSRVCTISSSYTCQSSRLWLANERRKSALS